MQTMQALALNKKFTHVILNFGVYSANYQTKNTYHKFKMSSGCTRWNSIINSHVFKELIKLYFINVRTLIDIDISAWYNSERQKFGISSFWPIFEDFWKKTHVS